MIWFRVTKGQTSASIRICASAWPTILSVCSIAGSRRTRDAVIRRSLDGMANNVHKVQGNASIRVDVNAPKNTHVGAEASGLFNTIETYRQTQMAAAQRGPANWGSVP